MPKTAAKNRAAIGAIVHYVWPDSGHHHAAIIANVLDAEEGYVTLGGWEHNGAAFASPWTAYDPAGAPGTWHYAEDADDADALDPAGLNIAPDGTTGVPTGTQAEVAGSRSDAERAADARVPRLAAKDDPVGHRTADAAVRAGTPDAIDRSAVTETGGERAAARARDGFAPATEPAAHNAAAEPSTKQAAEAADAKKTARKAPEKAEDKADETAPDKT